MEHMYLVLHNFDFVPSPFIQCFSDLQDLLSIPMQREGHREPAPVIQEDGGDPVPHLTALSSSGGEVEDVGQS